MLKEGHLSPTGLVREVARMPQTGSKTLDKKAAERKAPKLSRLYKPEGMSLEDWQIELRRQFGRSQDFQLANVGEHRVFSLFEVTNPQSKNTYRVQIRGPQVG